MLVIAVVQHKSDNSTFVVRTPSTGLAQAHGTIVSSPADLTTVQIFTRDHYLRTRGTQDGIGPCLSNVSVIMSIDSRTTIA